MIKKHSTSLSPSITFVGSSSGASNVIADEGGRKGEGEGEGERVREDGGRERGENFIIICND